MMFLSGSQSRMMDSWNKFLLTVDKVLPKKGNTLELPF